MEAAKLMDGLIKLDLVDEYELWLHPVILGKGELLFKELRNKLYLKLIGTHLCSSGVVMLHYQKI